MAALAVTGLLVGGPVAAERPTSATIEAAAETTPRTTATSTPEADNRPALAGRSLDEALRLLQAEGLEIVFTSRLVRPEMTVASEPASPDPRRRLDEILAPHGLAVSEGAGGILVVVPEGTAAAGPRSASAAIAGTVRSGASQRPLAGVKVRVVEPGIEVATGVDGRFAVGSLEAGTYTLEAQLPDHLPARLEGITVGAEAGARVSVNLRPLPYVHDEIVVRPSRLSLLADEPAAPLSLSRDEIESLPHLGSDVFRALSLMPGAAANDVSAELHVHGGRRDEVEIVLDGQELYDAFHLKDFDNALGIVAAESLASVQLSTGAFSAASGDRMSGVLDMRTTTPAGRRTRLSLSLLNATAASGGTLRRDGGAWMASARRGSIDLASRVFGKEDPSFWDLFAKLELELAPRHRVRGHVLHASDELNFDQRIDEETKSLATDYASSYLWLTHQALVGDRLLIDTALSTSRIDRDRRGIEDEDEQSFEVRDERRIDVEELSQTWTLEATARHALEWGFRARRYEADYDYFNRIERDLVVIAPGAIQPAGEVTRFNGDFRGEHLGAFASDRFTPVAPLTLELGLRYDRHTLTSETLWSPRLNAAWRLGSSSVVRASWGHFFQSHRPYELAVADGATAFSRAERSQHWVLGYERLFDGRERAPLSALRVELYHRDVEDPRPRFESLFEPINTFPEIEPDRFRVTPDDSRSQGIELVLRGAAGGRVDWWLTYAFSQVEDLFAGDEVRRSIDQPHTLNLIADTRLGEHWILNLAWRYRTGWPTTPVTSAVIEDEEGEPRTVAVLGPLYSRRLPDYHRMDLRASRRWQLASGELGFFVDLQNLYDRQNAAGFDLAIDEDTDELVISAESWPGFVPSIGISWEF